MSPAAKTLSVAFMCCREKMKKLDNHVIKSKIRIGLSSKKH